VQIEGPGDDPQEEVQVHERRRAARRQLAHGFVRRWRRQGCCCSCAVVRGAEAAALVVAAGRRPRRGRHREPRAGPRGDVRLRHEPHLRAGRVGGLRVARPGRGRRRGKRRPWCDGCAGPHGLADVLDCAHEAQRRKNVLRGAVRAQAPALVRSSSLDRRVEFGVKNKSSWLPLRAARAGDGGGGGRAVVRGLHLRHLPRAQPEDGAHLRRPRRGGRPRAGEPAAGAGAPGQRLPQPV
ncbi:hypothetical protein CFC21_067635, partial [Triticum aestivum]